MDDVPLQADKTGYDRTIWNMRLNLPHLESKILIPAGLFGKIVSRWPVDAIKYLFLRHVAWLEVSWNRGTPSHHPNFNGIFYCNQPFWVPPFMETPIWSNFGTSLDILTWLKLEYERVRPTSTWDTANTTGVAHTAREFEHAQEDN